MDIIYDYNLIKLIKIQGIKIWYFGITFNFDH